MCQRLGAKVALIENYLIGGESLSIGSIPTKSLLKMARVAHLTRQAEQYGVSVGSVNIDFLTIMELMRKTRADIAV